MLVIYEQITVGQNTKTVLGMANQATKHTRPLKTYEMQNEKTKIVN